MPERIISQAYEDALARLMDDESPSVRLALVDEFQRLGQDGLHLLKRFERSGNRILADAARRYLELLQGPDPVGEFTRFVRSLNYELETGCFLLNRTVQPGLDTGPLYALLDIIASRVRELTILPCSPWERCRVINRVLFHEYGFRGNQDDFDDPNNSLLGMVLRRRKGIPITLSILYLAVASRCGLDLEPVGMPGRFVVGCFLENRPFFIDPYERGGFRTEEELLTILGSNQLEPDPTFLTPVSTGEVLCRCCRNLVRQYSLRNDPAKAKLFAGFVREFEQAYRRHAEP